MKKTIMLPCFIVVFCVSVAHGAHFSHYAGSFRTASEAYAKDYYYYDGPYSSLQTKTDSVWVENEAAVLQANALCRSSVISGLRDNSLYIRMFSLSAAISLDSYGYAWGLGGISTIDDSTLGVFYKIEPDAGEELGDEVIVHWAGQISIEPMGNSPRGDISAYLSGLGEMDHLAVTKGQLPPVITAPDEATEVWTMPNIVLHNNYYYGFENIHTLKAQIGDVIGIFVGVGTGNTCSGYQSGTVISNLTATVTVESVLSGDLDGDGDVDFQDFAKFAENWLVGTTP